MSTQTVEFAGNLASGTSMDYPTIIIDHIDTIIAVIGGILGSEGWRKVLIPHFRSRRLSAPQVAGMWRYTDGTLKIRQTGTRIKATAQRASRWGFRIFEYRGELVGGQLVLTWYERSLKGYNVGTMVLRLSGDGDELRGSTTYVEKDSGRVVSHERTYTRTRDPVVQVR